ncbi:MAG TPA: thioredoxin family protein [bacterium]|nr:thioredoxin family protein [bacterium]HPN45954.1 thioredoxin family protein [bacterium]
MKKITRISFTLLLFLALSCQSAPKEKADTAKAEKKEKALVTFVELGSVNCIPCKAMQPVMKAIEERYGDQVKVIFYDVWKEESWAEKYKIRVIPTQVFLDSAGVEFHRHEGFYAQAEIEKLLTDKGLTAAEAKKD